MTMRSMTGTAAAMALALMLTAPGAAEAQEGFELEVRGGIPMSGGDHAVIYDQGYGGGFALNWWLKDRWALRIDTDIFKFKADDEQELRNFPREDLPDSRLFTAHLGTGVKLTEPDDSGVLLQLNGGAGLTVFDSGDLNTSPQNEDVNDPFFSLGAGAQLGFPVGGAVLGVDWRVYYVFSDPDTLCPLTLHVVELNVDPDTCATSGPSTVEAMETIIAYPLTVFVRFGLD